MTYLIRNKTTKEIIRTSDTPITIDETKPLGLDDNIEIVTILDRPNYDSSTQKLVLAEKIDGMNVYQYYNIVQLSIAELKQQTDSVLRMTNQIAARQRALDAIIKNKDVSDIWTALYDQAVGKGEILI